MTAIGVFVALIFAYCLVSRRLERSSVTGPMVFTATGILVATAAPRLAPQDVEMEAFVRLGEIALAVILFSDATRIRVRAMLKSAGLPARLLLIGMPLTIVAGTVAAALLFPDMILWEAAILATILAPTDASLGYAIVNSPRVPARIRRALNVESGLNDGFSLPFLMLFIALAQAEAPLPHFSWLLYAAQQIGYGLVVGLALGGIGGWLLQRATSRGWITEAFQQLGLLSLLLMCWGGADALGGNGFIAVFVGGLVVKSAFEEAGARMLGFSEAWGDLLVYSVLYLFGLIAAPMLGSLNARVLVWAALSLTLARMAPVALALIGTRLRPITVLFTGWFGPRGLASIVLGLVFLKQQTDLPGEPLIGLAVVATVLTSVFTHGISAWPGAELYGRQVDKMEAGAPERVEVANV